ncbi:cold shock domain-containing protein [Pseudomonas aeruginosa]|uniref:cold shock domain-containing protein n=1 Tax=Pseudomonas aeruginosa TaxID=287 RepID=UPI0015C2C503|nr:cold shock domain-containing protein [Pseudomonas aeruginosa]QLF20650.1 cold shock domain-containing protein [Pseudomonas aeruginosa]
MTASAGVVKWFGGYNKAKDAENKFGFLESVSGSDVFLHQSQWHGHSKPVERQLVYFELEEQNGKWSANNAKSLIDVSRDKQIELLEKIISGPKTPIAEAVSEFITSRISADLSSLSGLDAQKLIDRVGLKKLLTMLRWKREWQQNIEFLEIKGLIKPLWDIEWSSLPTLYITQHAEQMANYLQTLTQAESVSLVRDAVGNFSPDLRMFCLLAGYIEDIDEDDGISETVRASLDSYVKKIYSQSEKFPEYLGQYIKNKTPPNGGIMKHPLIGQIFSYCQFKKYLHEKDPKFINLYDATEYLQSRFDIFVLKEIFSLILAGNPLDTVYSLFLGRLWAAISSGNIDPAQHSREILDLFPACGTINRSLSCEAVYWEKQKMFLCRGRECTHPKVVGLAEPKNYCDFTIYDWFSHYGINYLFDKKPTSRDFPIKLAGYLNRLREIFKNLHCRQCSSLLLPDLQYSRVEYTEIENGRLIKKDMAPAYRLTVFRCPNGACLEYQTGHYINHCMGYDCYHIIDSRDCKTKCSSGRYICKGCGSCCSDHAKSNPVGLCPDCGSPLKLFESREYDAYKRKNKRYAKCENQQCNFSISPDQLSKRFYLDSCGPVNKK